MNTAQITLRLILRFEQACTSVAFLVMVLVLGWDILNREVLGSGKIWATPIAIYANVFLSFIGIGIASATGSHLRPKFFDKLVPQPLQSFWDRLTDFGFALFCAGASVLCWQMMQESIALQETDPVLQWQIWPFQLFMMLAFVLAVFRHWMYSIWPPCALRRRRARMMRQRKLKFKPSPTQATATLANPQLTPPDEFDLAPGGTCRDGSHAAVAAAKHDRRVGPVVSLALLLLQQWRHWLHSH